MPISQSNAELNVSGGKAALQNLPSNHFRLSEYGERQKGSILQVDGDHEFRLRMLEMGLTKGTEVMVVKYAPLTDPIEFVVKGYHLTLRRDQAADILMNEPGKEI